MRLVVGETKSYAPLKGSDDVGGRRGVFRGIPCDLRAELGGREETGGAAPSSRLPVYKTSDRLLFHLFLLPG